MKTTLAIWLMMFGIVLADGVVLFEKSTGKLQDKKILYTSDNGTKVYVKFWKLQPTTARVENSDFLGAQVLHDIDWTNFDLADFGTAKISDPVTTNDLTVVVPRNVAQTLTPDYINTQTADFDSWNKPELKALVLVLMDEINILRAKASLAPRTTTQLKSAIKAKL